MDESGEVVTTETRAARYVGGHTIDVTPADPQSPGPGEVRIDVAYTGICGTDLHILHGDMDQRVTVPAVLGHEMSGRIAEVGAGVDDWKVGDPVTVMPLEWCGQCPACLAGHQHICQRLNFVGIDSPGAMQSSWTVPSRILVRLPDEVSLRDAALVEPTAVAVHDVRRGQLVKGERVLVVGGGPVGLLVAAVAREAGGEVLVLEVDAHRRSVITGLGFDVLDPTRDDVPTYSKAGLAAPVYRWPSRCPDLNPVSTPPSTPSASAGGSWSSPSIHKRDQSACSGSSGVSSPSSARASTNAPTTSARSTSSPQGSSPPTPSSLPWSRLLKPPTRSCSSRTAAES